MGFVFYHMGTIQYLKRSQGFVCGESPQILGAGYLS